MAFDLDMAIQHCHDKAKELRAEAEGWSDYKLVSEKARKSMADCLECAKEHEQLASWLTELQERREADGWNVIHTEADLPKEDGFYLTTAEYVESISGELKRNTAELYFSTVFKSWSECGEDEDSDDDIIAWKHLPKPYESEGK